MVEVNQYSKSGEGQQRKRARRAIIVLIFLAVFLPSLAFSAYSFIYDDQVYANQYLGETNFFGKSHDGIEAELKRKEDGLLSNEIVLMYQSEQGEKQYSFKPSEIDLRIDRSATLQKIWRVGRGEDIKQSAWEQLRSIFVKHYHQAVYSYNTQALEARIKNIAKETDTPEKDYSLVYEDDHFVLSEERKAGKRINQESITNAIKDQFATLEREKVAFAADLYNPQVTEENAKRRLVEANQIVQQGSVVLVNESREFSLGVDDIGAVVKSRTKGDNLEIYFDDDRLKTFTASIAQSINVEARNAKLSITDGRATVFSPSQSGKTLDQEKTIEEIKKVLLARVSEKSEDNRISLPVTVAKPEISEGEINNLGIVELVGKGETNFKGSPANRVHNIQTGAAALNGIMLKPDETFSTLAKLGEISDKSGYLPELVIKENQTIPEFGGGLCQVSTTLFRAALNAGMKITARQNHKYRVSYYEPPVGMDATIYDPAPDFKFQNNYASHILIQSKVEGTKITFELYGTKDSRQVEVGQPVTWDSVSPGEPVIVETDTLPPGERKQIEKPHAGISAKFHYKVVKDGQTLQETDFYSKYVPWPEKWLVGKQPAPQPEQPAPQPEQTAAPVEQPAG